MTKTRNHRVPGARAVLAFALPALAAALACSAPPAETPPPEETAMPGPEDRNRAVVLRYFEEVINGRNLDLLDEILAADWIAHNPGEPNGREGLKQYFAGMFEAFPEVHADVKRIVAEDDLVVTHSHYTGAVADRGNDWAPGSGATVDIFRLEDGVIVEHWDVNQRPIPESSVNGNTMFDGGALYRHRE